MLLVLALLLLGLYCIFTQYGVIKPQIGGGQLKFEDINYMGKWDANTNTPTLTQPPASPREGDFYIVNVAGSQFNHTWSVGDWILDNGTEWKRIPGLDDRSKAQETQEVAEEELLQQGTQITDIAKDLQRDNEKVAKVTKSLETVNTRLNHNGELSEEEHQQLQKLAIRAKHVNDHISGTEQRLRTIQSSIPSTTEAEVVEETEATTEDEDEHPWLKAKKLAEREKIAEKAKRPELAERSERSEGSVSIGTHIKLTKDVLGNHNERLMRLEKHMCELKRKAEKNQAILSDIRHKLQNTVEDRQYSPAPGKVPDQSELVHKTNRVIKQNECKPCPVCPLYAQTHPVNILEVSGQGFGTIAPTSI